MALVTVVELPEFERRAKILLSDFERQAVIDYLARNPAAGVSLGSGLRKVRFARESRGKSGGYRTVHFFSGQPDLPIFLITMFAKNDTANLSPQETRSIRKLAQQLSDTYRRRS